MLKSPHLDLSGSLTEPLQRMQCNHSVTELLHQLAESLGKAIDAKDTHTLAHSEEVAVVSHTLALAMGLNNHLADIIHVAGHLHDLGKIGVPDHILAKPCVLTPPEWERVRTHPGLGADILMPLACLRESGIVDMVRSHHERFDGRDYPHADRLRLAPRAQDQHLGTPIHEPGRKRLHGLPRLPLHLLIDLSSFTICRQRPVGGFFCNNFF